MIFRWSTWVVELCLDQSTCVVCRSARQGARTAWCSGRSAVRSRGSSRRTRAWRRYWMRLFSEIGGATLEGTGSEQWAWLSIYLEKHSKCLKIIVLWRILRVQQMFLHISIHSSSACVRYLRRYHPQQTAPCIRLRPLPSNNELSAVKAHCLTPGYKQSNERPEACCVKPVTVEWANWYHQRLNSKMTSCSSTYWSYLSRPLARSASDLPDYVLRPSRRLWETLVMANVIVNTPVPHLFWLWQK